ncbi:peroxiredoxin [Methyloceanibacter sp. wino2]|uniref:peroxiredoxin n=1 Tax=Methyloceanibacter sp. wino2 TaxID=2170729 RepID=UPI001ABA06A2|nr:peroxiredoxin [Methyloceanibacter sp. wino2]
MSSLQDLPDDLPRPIDDGACDHLAGRAMPEIVLASTKGRDVNLGALGPGRTVIYCYPRTGVPGEALPDGWDAIPGARGCTPQACAFRDHAADLARLGAQVFGLSTQDTAYQREMAERLHLPFEILSDDRFAFTEAMRLPTFTLDGMRLIKRLTLIVRDGAIEHVFYPVFPPTSSAADVVAWLESRA